VEKKIGFAQEQTLGLDHILAYSVLAKKGY